VIVLFIVFCKSSGMISDVEPINILEISPWSPLGQRSDDTKVYLTSCKTDFKHVQYNLKHYAHRIKRIWKSLFTKKMNTKAIHNNKICWKGNPRRKRQFWTS
jgi:hypothetical protein